MVRVSIRLRVSVRVGVADCCIQTAGKSDKMRINHVIKTAQWRSAPQIRPAPHFVVSLRRASITLTRVKADSSSCGSEPSKIQRYCTHLALYRTDESDSCRKLAGARVGRRSTVGRAGSIWRRRAESNGRSQTRDTQRREPGRRSSSLSDCVPALPAHRQRYARSVSRALSLSSESYLAHTLED